VNDGELVFASNRWMYACPSDAGWQTNQKKDSEAQTACGTLMLSLRMLPGRSPSPYWCHMFVLRIRTVQVRSAALGIYDVLDGMKT